ncbi:MAG: GGDEF domain-containing protein [Thiobacillus sp.]|nr:GGDEF domain-containing protein [Thiobacillus sp.]
MTAPPPQNLYQRWLTLGVAPDDSDDLRLKKSVLTLVSSGIAFLAIFWGALYIYSGYPLSGAIPLSYTVITLLDPTFADRARPMPSDLNTLYFLMNLGCGSVLIALMLHYFVRDRERAYGRLLESEAHIRELMLTDTLTGVANRRHLNDRLEMELARQARYGQPLSVILTDIDRFKHVNDTYGHAAGDDVLVAFARTLEASIRSSDFLARYGGEEFVLLLPNTGIEEATALAERMREATGSISIPETAHRITASFGVTLARRGESMAEVLSRADEAMYQSKSGGRDRVTTLVD